MTGTRCQPGSPRAGASPSRSRDLAAAHTSMVLTRFGGRRPTHRRPLLAWRGPCGPARRRRRAATAGLRASRDGPPPSPGAVRSAPCAPTSRKAGAAEREMDVPRGCRPSSRGRDGCPAVSVSAPRRPGCTTCGTSPPAAGAVHKDDARHPTPLCPEARILISASRVNSLFRPEESGPQPPEVSSSASAPTPAQSYGSFSQPSGRTTRLFPDVRPRGPSAPTGHDWSRSSVLN